MRPRRCAWLPALALATQALAATPSTIQPGEFGAFAYVQHLGARLPLDIALRGGNGRPVTLGSLFGGMPVALDFEYDRCTTLCGVVLDQVSAALRAVPMRAGRDYRLVAVDIDPDASSEDADTFAREHGVEGPGTMVLTGSEPAIRHLADAAGFPFRRDAATGQYAHPAGLVIVAPDGRVSRYLLGLEWRPFDLRLALAEAAQGGIAAPAESVLLLCYCYDPATGRYDLAVSRLLKAIGAATVLALTGLVWIAARPGAA